MKQISINNGATYITPAAALEEISLDTMAEYMYDDTREAVHNEIAPCTDLEFLERYLEIAPDDLINGEQPPAPGLPRAGFLRLPGRPAWAAMSLHPPPAFRRL